MDPVLVMEEVVTACTRAFFEEYGLVITRADCAVDSYEYFAVIGFSADGLRGSLGVGVAPRLLDHMLKETTAGKAKLASFLADDCLAEASNQILGRVKNQLISYGADMSIAVPMVLRGMHVRLVASPAHEIRSSTFTSSAGPLSVWLDARFEEGVDLQPHELAERPVAEGDFVVF